MPQWALPGGASSAARRAGRRAGRLLGWEAVHVQDSFALRCLLLLSLLITAGADAACWW